jgi:O-antigen ligase
VTDINRDRAKITNKGRVLTEDVAISNGRHEPSSQASADETDAGARGRPSALEWVIAVAVAVIQQGAFTAVPALLTGESLTQMAQPTSKTSALPQTVSVALAGLAVGILCLVHRRLVISVARRNSAFVLLGIIIVASSLWSIHPGISFWHSGSYFLMMLIVAYLSGRFSMDDLMQVLSFSFALSAIGSFLFVAAYPQYGIMPDEQTGVPFWRGTFLHKNLLGWAMMIGVFVNSYIFANSARRSRLHLVLLIGCFVLVVLSGSGTAFVCSLWYLMGTCIYLLWTRARRIALGIFPGLAALGLMALIIVFSGDYDAGFALIGKDATLTGRTNIWAEVPKLIAERPLLGWGYDATWQPDDDYAVYAWNDAHWGAGGSHNSYLEVALQLGLIGALTTLAVIAIALWRSMCCLFAGLHRLGAFALLFFLGIMGAAMTEGTLATMSIEWFAFNLFSFRCGLEIAQFKAQSEEEAAPTGSILSRAKPT